MSWKMLTRVEISTVEKHQYTFAESFGIMVIWQIIAADKTNKTYFSRANGILMTLFHAYQNISPQN